MVKCLRCSLVALLAGSLPSCGGGGDFGSGKTCYGYDVTYAGTKSGHAYLRAESSNDGGASLFSSRSADSIQDLIFFTSIVRVCWEGGEPVDLPVTAVAWIDVTGVGAANCSDTRNPQCQPLPTDPQARQSAVLRYGQMTRVRLDVVDPPP